MKSKITQIMKGEFMLLHDRHLFSCHCSATRHKCCKGHVSKSRCLDRICRCPCHKIEGVDQ